MVGNSNRDSEFSSEKITDALQSRTRLGPGDYSVFTQFELIT